MEKSKSIAGIVGPTLIVTVFSEMKLWNPTLYDTQIMPLIYLNGVLLFVAGLAIVKSHNIWIYGWQTLITIIGYIVIIVGLFRMFFPQIQKAKFDNSNSILIVEIILILIGIFLTFKAYFPTNSDSNKAFLKMLISKRLPLTDYPEKVSEDFVVYEPASLPFGGKYLGLADYYALAPQLTEYYDYSRFELTAIYADGDVVFVTLKVGLKKSEKHILLCEQFTFKEDKIEEIKIFILD